jgi:S1-C subfamily serine protease
LSAELHVVHGGRAGLVHALSDAECTIGRHPRCALRFGAEEELGVSGRHAALLPDGAGWLLKDLGSTNGTYLNGRRIESPATLRDGDRIAFGPAGPVVEFRDPASRAASAAPVRRRPIIFRAAAAVVLCMLLASGAAAFHLFSRSPTPPRVAQADAADATRRGDLLPPRRDSQSTEVVASDPRIPLPSARRSDDDRPSPGRPRKAPAIVAKAPPTEAPARAPAPPPATAPVRSPVARTVEVDRRNRFSVARIFVEDADGEVSTGTAFAVRADGTLITNRHVVGGSVRKIAVQFASSTQVWPARVVAVSERWDLAAVRSDGIVGTVPTVRGLNLRPDTLPEGTPVMLVGFPGAGEAQEGGAARAAQSPATVAGVRGGRVEIYARSSVGASGSPVFDANGQVVAILFGGSPRAARPLVYGVPASAIVQLLGEP